MLLSERLPLAASRYPEAQATVRNGQAMTYRELHQQAERLGVGLLAEGLRPGDRVALLGEPDPLLVVALYAAVGIHAIPLALSPSLTAVECAAILEDAEPRILIHDQRNADKVLAITEMLVYPPKRIAVDEASPNVPSLKSLMQHSRDSSLHPPADIKQHEDDTAVLIYTGGTTGRPKGVMHSHRSMAAWNQFTPSAGFGYDRERRVLVLNLSHLVGQFQLWATMAAGGCLIFLDEYPADVHRILAAVERDRVTHLSTVGQLLRDITHEVSAARRDMRSLKVIGCGGSVIPPNTLQGAVAQFPGALIVNNYSQAECGMSISRLFPAQHLGHSHRLHSVGRPADLAAQGEQAFQVRIVTMDGREAEANESGEIVVRGAQVMSGYWRQPDSTAAAMQGGWVRTGDAGYLDPDGYLYVMDRLKDMVIVGGSNVYCAEVEQVIAAHMAVRDAAVVGLPLPDEGERLVACVVLGAGGSMELDELQAWCEPRLAPHKWPTQLVVLESLPRTAVDKVDKKQLRKQLFPIS